MILYHLGFAAHSYLASRVFPALRVIECQPLTDTVRSVVARLRGEKDFLFHIDLSVQNRIPPRRADLIKALAAAGAKVHNAHHADQRKRLLQRIGKGLGLPSLTATRSGNPNERLIIKTDLNVAGGPERRTVRRFPGLPLPPLPRRVCSPFEYYVARRVEVPAEVWNDRTLHIEKYVENPKGQVLRTFWNQGKGVVSLIENPHETVKKHNEKCRRWNYGEPVDPMTKAAFARMRIYAEHLCLSFFAADWVLDDDGAAFLVDLNLTPQWAVNPGSHTNNMTPGLAIHDIPRALAIS